MERHYSKIYRELPARKKNKNNKILLMMSMHIFMGMLIIRAILILKLKTN